ncbi:MAG: hypothetical protein WBG86_11665 [Polyangiales bacterium]
MRHFGTIAGAAFAAIALHASVAVAQWAPTAEPAPSGAVVAPTPPPAPPDMVEAPPPQMAPSLPPQEKGLEVGFTWALQIGVPIFLDVDRDIVRPGADISFFGAADFDWFSVGGAFGFGWTPIDLNGQVIDGIRFSGRSPLSRVFMSVPEFRFQVPNLGVAFPYISGALDLNWWNFRETGIECGFYWCNQFSVYRFTPGFTGRVGMGFRARGGFYVDVGLRYSLSGKGDFFLQKEWWLTPYVGVMLRRRK